MPSWVLDHELWKQARAKAAEQGSSHNFALTTHIYKEMGGKVKGKNGDDETEKGYYNPTPSWAMDEKLLFDVVRIAQNQGKGNDWNFIRDLYRRMSGRIRKGFLIAKGGELVQFHTVNELVEGGEDLQKSFLEDSEVNSGFSRLMKAHGSDLREKLAKFFKENPDPPDDKVHKFARRLGMNEHRFEEEIYSLIGDFWAEGEAQKKGITEKDVDPKELAMGIKVEMEHTSCKHISARIALDHLAEFPDYYTRLAKMEKEADAAAEKSFAGHGGRPGQRGGSTKKTAEIEKVRRSEQFRRKRGMSEIETMLRKIFRTLIQAKRMKVTDREFDSEYRKLVHNAGIIPKDEADKWLSRAKEVALSMGKSFNYIDWLELLFSSEE